jgi:hypothetical protein
MQVFRQGNVVVEYYFKLRDGRAVERNRLADVRRVLVAL